MKVRVLVVSKNEMVVVSNVREVKYCGNFFRLLFMDGTAKDYSYKYFDCFPASVN